MEKNIKYVSDITYMAELTLDISTSQNTHLMSRVKFAQTIYVHFVA